MAGLGFWLFLFDGESTGLLLDGESEHQGGKHIRKSHGIWQLIRNSMNAVCFLYYNASLK